MVVISGAYVSDVTPSAIPREINTLRVSSGSQRAKSWYSAHSTDCIRFF